MQLLKEFAIQLWSVRDVMQNNYKNIMTDIAKMGYTGVEFAAGYGGLSAEEMKQLLAANKLKPVGSHIGFDGFLNNLDEEIAFHKAIGTEYLICPFYKLITRDDVLQFVELCKPIIEKIDKAGMKFGYHNHAHEFAKDGDQYLLDILFEKLPPQAVMELDVFWAVYAGVEPFSYMEKHKDRLELIHVKQIGIDKRNVDIEEGLLNYKVLISKAKAVGAKHFIMEQEAYDVSSIVSAKKNVDYILKLEE